MKLLSWNVNGIRACERKGFASWLESQDADIVCIQETKAQPDQLADSLLRPAGYQTFWHSAQKKGYSGVATFTRRKPISVREGLGIAKFDREGRVLITEFRGFVLVNAYFPNSRREGVRLEYKLQFCRAMRRLLDEIRSSGKHVVLCGDYNIAHREIDLARPKDNVKNAGFLPRERSWLDRLVRAEYVDTFRSVCDEPGQYSWWSYRSNLRERNVGWRLDYFFVSPRLENRLRGATIQSDVMGSDHCPVGMELR